MAKKPKVTIQENPFAKTDRPAPARGQDPAGASSSASQPRPAAAERHSEPGDKVRAVSVSLRESEYAAFDEIAAGLNPAATRMAVMNEALRIFMRMHMDGRIKIASSIEAGRVVVRETK
jgi:hypothetical protein